MEWVMCLACGDFVQAIARDGGFVALTDECLTCGSVEFKHNGTGTELRTDD